MADSCCDTCPLRNQLRVASRGPEHAELVLIGQSPGSDEIRSKRPFTGASGELLKRTLAALNVDIENVWIQNAVPCAPPDDFKFTPSLVINCARRHLYPELVKVKAKAIVTLGNEAWLGLFPSAGMYGVEQGAGQVEHWRGVPVVRGLHPSAVLHATDNMTAFLSCLDRGIKLARGEWSPRPDPTLTGTLREPERVVPVLEHLLSFGGIVAADIETQGQTKAEALDEYRGQMVGVALSDGEDGWFIPWRHQEVSDNEAQAQQQWMWPLLKRVLTECQLVAHFKSFECRWWQRHFDFRPNIVHDTLPAHHLWDETVPHRLEYMSRWLLGAQDWKDVLQEALSKQGDVECPYCADGATTVGRVLLADEEPGPCVHCGGTGKQSRRGNYYVDLPLLGQYAAGDAYNDWHCWNTMWESPRFRPFALHGPKPLYTELVQPLTDVLLDIETAGLGVDQQALAPAHEAMQQYVAQADQEINALALDGMIVGQQWPSNVYTKLRARVKDAQAKHAVWGIEWCGGGDVSVSGTARGATNWLAKTLEYMGQGHRGKTTYLGPGVQPSSDDQMRWLLFEWLGLKPIKSTDGGDPSVDKESLTELRRQLQPDPFSGDPDYDRQRAAADAIDALLRRRKIAKLDSTYVLGLLEGGLVKDDGRVHPKYGFDPDTEMGVRTGRLSSTAPNLQNQAPALRPLYIPADGHVFVEADYAAMEIRCLCHVSRDGALREALEQADIHRSVASMLFGVPYDEVTDEERRRGKTMNFALLYGMGTQSMAVRLGITEDEAESLTRTYFSRFPRVNHWIQATQKLVKTVGFVVNPLGRVRRLPAAMFVDGGALGMCLRQGVNAVIQSEAADITNLALIRMSREIEGYKDWWRIVNTVHDSVLCEVRRERADELVAEMQRVMTAQPFEGFDVPLVVDIKVTERWGGELELGKLLSLEDEDG